VTEVSAALTNRWRSRKHVGAARPTVRVEIQRGRMMRHHSPFTKLDGSRPRIGYVVGDKWNGQPWHAFWNPSGPWIDLPNVASVEMDIQLNNGVAEPAQATITLDNILAASIPGELGNYRRLERGGLSPLRGFHARGRPRDRDATRNDWYNRLTSGFKVRVWQGYGDAQEPTFVGLIDDYQGGDLPDQATIVCRNFGQLLTDQRFFGWSKIREVAPPIVFADRRRAEAKPKGTKDHILVNDASDVIKWLLMWCGFREWVVAPTGVRLKEPVTFHQSNALGDPIAKLIEQVNFVFYIEQPTDKPGSIGVPHFVPNAATDPPSPRIQQVTDNDLLTGLQTRFSKEELRYIIRVRGKMAKGGVRLGEDRAKRIRATYRPPWSTYHGQRDEDWETGMSRLSGVMKRLIWVDNSLRTERECKMSAVLIAMQEALAAYTASIEVPGYPGFSLNGQVSIIDTPSGVNQRLWISRLSSTQTTGENAEWKQTVEGALIDTPDLAIVMSDYRELGGR
jgi:hypothetical protein